MKKMLVGGLIKEIEKTNKYDKIKIEEIKYGLESIYLTLSKLIVISIVAYMLNIFKELLIFLFIYNIIRLPSFGLHATKSWICLATSLIIFILCPLICLNIIIPNHIKFIIGILLVLFFYKYAPADTKKRPIISFKRRVIYKTISVFIVVMFTILAMLIKNNFLSNCLIFSIIIQSFMISPHIYKLFNLSYDNYKIYLEENVV